VIRLDTACVRNGWNDEQELESKRKPWYLSTRGHYSIWHGCNSRALVIASPWIQFLVWWHWGQESRKSLALAPPSLDSPVNRSMDTFSSAADIQYHHDVDVRNETRFTRPLRTRYILAQGATPSALGKPNRKVHVYINSGREPTTSFTLWKYSCLQWTSLKSHFGYPSDYNIIR
jgi:hypothetical protein